ncbi:hypothetical protein GOBAR_DD23884 [Gossypium barbadense]|nr:hypothetical protein GOBAR_DD23884 [Gossypium barbadense]
MVLSMFDYQEARRILNIQLVQKGVTNKLRWCLESFGYIRELELLIGERVERAAEETVAWQSPLKPFFRVNFDVGFYELQAASTGIIIRNSTGLIIGAVYPWNRYVSNASVAKALAGTQAFRFTQELGFLAIEFEGESLVVITKLRAACIDRSEISNHMWEAKIDCVGF